MFGCRKWFQMAKSTRNSTEVTKIYELRKRRRRWTKVKEVERKRVNGGENRGRQAKGNQ